MTVSKNQCDRCKSIPRKSIKLALHDAICLATCIATFIKAIHSKLQQTYYRVQSRTATSSNCKNPSKNSLQSFQKVEQSSTLCYRRKYKKVAGQVTKRACYMLHLPATCLATPLQLKLLQTKEIAPCNTSCVARIFFWQRLQRFFETIASCSLRLQSVTCLLQFAINFFFLQRCKTSCKGNCIV